MLASLVGTLLIAAVLLDALLTVLDANGRSLFSTGVYRALWWGWRHFARLLPGGVRQAALSVAAPLMVPLLIALWIVLLVIGFALLFHAGMSMDNPVTGDGSQPGFAASMRLSWVTLSTIGFVEISPSNMAYSVTVALEALLGSVIITFSITYFLKVQTALRDLRRLVVALRHRMDPINQPEGCAQAVGRLEDAQALHRWLETLHDRLVAVHDGLTRYPIIYFYRPEDEDGLPFILETLFFLVSSLEFANGSGRNPSAKLLRRALEETVHDLSERLVPQRRRHLPAPVSKTAFICAFRGRDVAREYWVGTFIRQWRSGQAIRGGARPDSEEAIYALYRKWLGPAALTHHLIAAIRRDLGYVDDLRPHRTSRLDGLLQRGPVQRPQPLRVKDA